MNVTCEKCNNSYELTKEKEEEVAYAASKNRPFLVDRCPICRRMVMLHPLALMGITDELPVIEDNRVFHCPTLCCIGFVEYDKKNKIYQCVSCLNEWKTKKELYHDITKIVKKYPHRKDVYIKIKNGWKTIPIGASPNDYESTVQSDEIFED